MKAPTKSPPKPAKGAGTGTAFAPAGANAPDLTTRAMLCTLKVSVWSGKRDDSSANLRLASDFRSDASMHKVRKSLIEPEAMKDIAAAVSDARTLFYHHTSCWQDEGKRLLPVRSFQEFDTKLAAVRTRFSALVKRFLTSYDQHILEAQGKLGAMFNAADYPSADEIEHRFGFNVLYEPLVNSNDWRISLSEDQMDALREGMAERQRELLEAALREQALRVYTVTKKLAEKLALYGEDFDQKKVGVFRDSLIENVREIAEMVPAMNLGDNPVLDKAARELTELLGNSNARDLREDDGLRNTVARKAQEIAGRLTGLM